MSLIDATFFVKKLSIPNTADAAVAETVTSYINQYETMFLVKLLGYPLYKAYKDSPEDQRFKDILNGKEYANLNGLLTKWPGLIEVLVPAPTQPATTPAGQKQSIIANFVYYWYRVENATQFTGVGEVLMVAENTTMVSPRKKLAMVWNEMRVQVYLLMQFLDANQSTYSEWSNIDKIEALKYFGYMNPHY